MNTQINYFQIGNFYFSITRPCDFIIPDNFLKFERKEKDINSKYHYDVDYISDLPDIDGNKVANRSDLLVIDQEGLETRLIGIKGSPHPYALYREKDQFHASISFIKHYAQGLHIDPVFTSLFALERRLIQKDALILHCAYIQYNDSAILFSAPSETGKTTQANLWKKYKNAPTVNGDRSLLQKDDDVWTAKGWPVCGTSEISNNQNLPIRCIVMLSQSKDGKNHVEKMRISDAFRMIYSQITLNGWNSSFVNHGIDLISILVEEVPVYHLTCTISEEAVDILYNRLMEDSI